MGKLIYWLSTRRAVAWVLTIAVILIGLFGLYSLPLDAVPDVTNNQVIVVTAAPALGANEVERIITLPVERGMMGVPGLKEMRSVSKLGISLVTLIFYDEIDIFFARAQVNERLTEVREKIPESAGRPELGPIATGLGEIFMFELRSTTQTPEELRTMLDWDIGPKLRQVPGIIETVNFGGSVRQYHVTLDPARLAAQSVSIEEVKHALERDNANAGGGAIEKAGELLVLRAEARYKSLDEIRATVVKTLEGGAPLTVGMLAEVDTGPAIRAGAMTADGKGEIVGGSVLMLKGQNSREVVQRVEVEVARIQKGLPKGVEIVPFLNRSEFIERTVHTVVKNLIEGALIVVVVLFLTLGSLRAGLLVAGAIPFAMLVAFAGLKALGMSANIMSLGSVDFGIVVEGTVVVTEHALHSAAHAKTLQGRKGAILDACAHAARPVMFAVIIVVMVFLPLATLEDVEGKMFRPVVASLVFMLSGALFYALVFVPTVAPALLGAHVSVEEPWLIRMLRRGYEPLLARGIRAPLRTTIASVIVAALCIAPGANLGAEFLPRIFEGAFAIDARRPVSVSLSLAIALTDETEKALKRLPEVERVITRIGRTEGSIDPAGPEASDVFVILRPREEWRDGMTPESLVGEMDKAVSQYVPGTIHAFSQPIEMRVNDLIAGVKSDVALKVFGDDLTVLSEIAEKFKKAFDETPGAADVKRETPIGLPSVRVVIQRDKAARLGVAPESVLDAVAMARAGQQVGLVYEGERSFDLMLRLGGDSVQGENDISRLPIATAGGDLVPLSSIADVITERGISQISREKARRRLVIEANVRGRDLVGFVEDAKKRVAAIELPPGTEIAWGGQFENYTRAKTRLSLLFPIALAVIALMLWAGYRSVPLTLVTLATLPFALAGGVLALVLRGLPFSIPAAVGFIALAGVAVMGGAVMTARLLETDRNLSDVERVTDAAISRFRPMISTALVAALGFIPMAIATGAGAEVQRPLATVVIGGLIIDTMLTVFAMPAMMLMVMRHFPMPMPAEAPSAPHAPEPPAHGAEAHA